MSKLLFIISTFQKTGPVNILFNLIKELDRDKFTPIILSLSEENKNYISARSELEALDVILYSLSISRFDGFILGKRKILAFCKEKNIEIIHLIGFRADFIVRSKSFRKYKIISSIFSNIFDDYPMLYGRYKGLLMAYFHLRSLKGKKIVACSDFVKTELSKKTNLDFIMIPNGVSKEKFKVPNDMMKHTIRQQLQLYDNKKVFIFVGVLIKRKDPLTTIKGFINSRMINEGYLIVLGDGPLMQECKKLAEGYDSIQFMGNTSETLSYLYAADYYISSSLSEGLPTSVVEALACGLPLILSDIGPHNEILNLINSTRYSFPVKDSAKLTMMINEIIADNYDELSNKSRMVVDLYLNSEIMTLQYQSIYKS